MKTALSLALLVLLAGGLVGTVLVQRAAARVAAAEEAARMAAQARQPAIVAAAAAAPQEAEQDAGRDTKGEGPHTPLDHEMEKIDKAMEFMKRAVRDVAQHGACLEQIVAAEQACLNAKLLAPKMAATLPEAERPKFMADYRKSVATLLAEFLNLEVALLDGDLEKAKALWRKLDEMEMEGHNTFTTGD